MMNSLFTFSKNRWCFLWVGLFLKAYADVSVPVLFSDGAVLQVGDKTPVWGWAEAQEEVKVSLGEVKAETKADENGKWRVELNLPAPNSISQELVIQGKNKLTFKDVLIGEVWLCSGQSNMEWLVKFTTGAGEEVAQSTNSLLREFYIPRNAQLYPQERIKGRWITASPSTTGIFSGAAYYFGKKLQKTLQCPVAVICSSFGGTSIEPWISEEGFKGDATLSAGRERQHQPVKRMEGLRQKFAEDLEKWATLTQRQNKPAADPVGFCGLEVDVTSWNKVKLPGDLTGAGMSVNGIFWARKHVELSQNLLGKDYTIILGNLSGFEEVYWNGVKLGQTTPALYPGRNGRREYYIPTDLLKAGKNVLALRVYAPLEKPQITGDMGLGYEMLSGVPITGEWFVKTECEFPPVSAGDPDLPKLYESVGALQGFPSTLYNGMIHPLVSYGIRGVNWYQGESSVARAVQYKESLKVLIQDWRRLWGKGDLYFNVGLLAGHLPKKDIPGDSGWAELRNSQLQTYLSLPGLGLANFIDIGEAEDIHPRNKKDAGERLALNALADVYQVKIPHAGPLYDSMKVEGNSIKIEFKNVEGSLVAKPLAETYLLKSSNNTTAPLVKYSPQSELQGFAICGEDKQWKWADAKIEGNSVIVTSSQVAQPVAVRYAWADNPTCNLYNDAGLPAVPFRTDTFPLTRDGKNY